MSEESKTPLTDAETMRDEYDHVDTEFGPFAPSDTVSADFARDLERQLAEARESKERILERAEAIRCELVKATEQRERLAEALARTRNMIRFHPEAAETCANDALSATKGGTP